LIDNKAISRAQVQRRHAAFVYKSGCLSFACVVIQPRWSVTGVDSACLLLKAMTSPVVWPQYSRPTAHDVRGCTSLFSVPRSGFNFYASVPIGSEALSGAFVWRLSV